jgi:hypothetical protein
VNFDGIRYVHVALTHPDGSGIILESGSFEITWPLPERISPEDKEELLQVSRDRPPYTVEQLAEVALAIDKVVSG